MAFRRKTSKYSLALTGLMLIIISSSEAYAGDFDFGWDIIDWPVNSIGPNTFTASDENGYEIQFRIEITRFGGTPLNGFPDDRLGFGTQESLWVVWDPTNGNGNVGDSTNTVTLEILNSGAPFPVDGLNFEVTDIDASDNNAANDRCDFVTFNGNAGTPTLTYKEPNAALRSFVIGPGPGSGATGQLAANEAQCIYNIGAQGSPSSSADDNGTVVLDYPSGTHTVTLAYDESISDVTGNNNLNPAARGGGFFAGTVAVTDLAISLEKSTTITSFSSVGEVIPYSYTITNDGPLAINTNQNILIQDDKIGTFTCGTITADIPVGGTHSCTGNYTVTAADLAAGNVTNIAVAGVGTGTQPFAERLQSNDDTVTVDHAAPSLSIDKVANNPGPYTVGDVVTYTYTVTNDGNVNINNVAITDTHNGSDPPPVPSNETLLTDNGTAGDSTDQNLGP